LALPANADPEALVYTFKGGTDGSLPAAPLLDVGGVLYGTTSQGGAGGSGTVFSLTQAGVEKVLYSFKGKPDGAGPAAGLIYLKGRLWGTAFEGGPISGPGTACYYGCGTVFAVSLGGKEKTVYAFQGAGDGLEPNSGLTEAGDLLYGTTCAGGSVNAGTVFSLTPEGTEKVVYSFQGGADGDCPSGLINVKGTLYGTAGGGASGNGTVYSLTRAGIKTTLYQFQGGADGFGPNALTRLGDLLYGTTTNGGAMDGGTVFAVNSHGGHRVIYSFKGYTDGQGPVGSLLNFNNILYGATEYGGALEGGGTIFAVTPAGKERVLHRFLGGSADGLQPAAGLIGVSGVLYGTTLSGGQESGGSYEGTVFTVKP
jgi:uncharacterized repeat protein (TIGR03803 family)